MMRVTRKKKILTRVRDVGGGDNGLASNDCRMVNKVLRANISYEVVPVNSCVVRYLERFSNRDHYYIYLYMYAIPVLH